MIIYVHTVNAITISNVMKKTEKNDDENHQSEKIISNLIGTNGFISSLRL